jgi:hypothetical protein
VLWILAAVIVAASLVALAVALLRAWRAYKGLAGAVSVASRNVAAAGELTVQRERPVPTEAELLARAAALDEREADLVRREAAVAARRGRRLQRAAS